MPAGAVLVDGGVWPILASGHSSIGQAPREAQAHQVKSEGRQWPLMQV